MRRAWLCLPCLLLAAACTSTPTAMTPQSSVTRPPATLGATRTLAVVVSTHTLPPPSATATFGATTTPAATNTGEFAPAATATPALSPTATITGEGPCLNSADYLADLTVPDGTQFEAGQLIYKQWSVRNNGTCDWNSGYRLVLVSGNALGARSEVMLYPARAGAEAVIEIGMVAPAEPGSYTGRWQARSPEGDLFGDRIFITIEVVAPPPPPTDTPTP
jgi:hypothetical protein